MAWFNKVFNANNFGAAASGFLQGYGNSLQNRFAQEDRLAAQDRSTSTQLATQAKSQEELDALVGGSASPDALRTAQARLDTAKQGAVSEQLSAVDQIKARVDTFINTPPNQRNLNDLIQLRSDIAKQGAEANALRGKNQYEVDPFTGEVPFSEIPDLAELDSRLSSMVTETAMASADFSTIQEMMENSAVSGDTVSLRSLEKTYADYGGTAGLFELYRTRADRVAVKNRINDFLSTEDFDQATAAADEALANQQIDIHEFNGVQNRIRAAGMADATAAFETLFSDNTAASLVMANNRISELPIEDQQVARDRVNARSFSNMQDKIKDYRNTVASLGLNLFSKFSDDVRAQIRTELSIIRSQMSMAEIAAFSTGEATSGVTSNLSPATLNHLNTIKNILNRDPAALAELKKDVDMAKAIMSQSGANRIIEFRNNIIAGGSSATEAGRIMDYLIPFGTDAPKKLEELAMGEFILIQEYNEVKAMMEAPEVLEQLMAATNVPFGDPAANFIARAKQRFSGAKDKALTLVDILRESAKKESNGELPAGTTSNLQTSLFTTDTATVTPLVDVSQQSLQAASQPALQPSPISRTFSAPGPAVSPQTAKAVRGALPAAARRAGSAAGAIGRGYKFMTDIDYYKRQTNR